MWFFVVMILIAAFLQTLAVLSLLPRTWSLLAVLSIVIAVFSAYPWAVMINTHTVAAMLSHPGTLQSACVTVMVQSIVSLLLGLALLQRRGMERKPAWYMYAGLLPPLLFPAGCFLALVFLLNQGLPLRFPVIAGGFCAAAGMILCCGVELIRQAFRQEAHRIELVSTIYLAQIATAMFLPIIATPSSAALETTPINLKTLIFFAVILVAVAVSAWADWLWSRRKNRN
ncbi:MAG: hypothetical protein ACYC4Q_03195 [Victivallaceae bacterium]